MTGIFALVALLAQSGGPTVGDTIWLSRTVALPPGYVARAADWDPADPIELLGRPRVIVIGDSAEIAYPVVVWRPGQQLIDLPGPLLLGPGGTVDSLAGKRVRLDVRSVLPAVPPDSLLPPQPRAGLVLRREVSPTPLAILWLVALTLLLPLHLWWRRRGKPVRTASPTQALPDPPLARWADAGEYRAVANVAAVRLRAAVAQRVATAHPGLDTERLLAELAAVRPDWPLKQLENLLRALDDVRFGQTGSPETLGLAHSTLEMRDRLLREAA
ncbi:MAG TPA: hypothetical protein VGJ36_11080 [Gemmatimonadales bacterium]|jgi:hypothetical protein